MDNSSRGVRQIELPPAAQSHCNLSSVDYTDAFVVDISGGHYVSAEQWARTILEDAPLRFQRTAPWAWRALGLERGPLSSATSILSWPIRSRSDDVVCSAPEAVSACRLSSLSSTGPTGCCFRR